MYYFVDIYTLQYLYTYSMIPNLCCSSKTKFEGDLNFLEIAL